MEEPVPDPITKMSDQELLNEEQHLLTRLTVLRAEVQRRSIAFAEGMLGVEAAKDFARLMRTALDEPTAVRKLFRSKPE